MKRMIGLALLLTGCDPAASDLQQFIRETEHRIYPELSPAGAKDSAIKAGAADPVMPVRNPFRFAVAQPGDASRDSSQHAVLANTPLEDLRMVGSLSRKGRTQALVMAPDQTLHRVSQGDHLGLQRRVVEVIDEQGIQLHPVADAAEPEQVLRLERGSQSL